MTKAAFFYQLLAAVNKQARPIPTMDRLTRIDCVDKECFAEKSGGSKDPAFGKSLERPVVQTPRVERLFFDGFDGTRIAYQKVGQGRPVVMANGLGGTFAAWRHLYTKLAEKWKILCWDYRGLYDSGPPCRPGTLSIPFQCKDLERLLEVEEVEDAVFMGWSMGTQVCLEFYRAHSSMFKGMVLLNGTHGRPFDTVMGTRLLKDVIPKLIALMDVAAPLVNMVVGAAGRFPLLVPALQSAGLVGETLDMDIFRELVGEFAKLDFHLYAETLNELGNHDAKDVLEIVDCPVLVISGDRDLMTPVEKAMETARMLNNSELHIIPKASHYAAVEYPDAVNALVEAFLEKTYSPDPEAI